MLEKLFLCHHKHRLGAAAADFLFFFFLKNVWFFLVEPIIIVRMHGCVCIYACMLEYIAQGLHHTSAIIGASCSTSVT